MNVTIITGLDVREIYHATWESCFDSIRKHGLIARGANGEGKAHIFATIKSALDNTPPLRLPTCDTNPSSFNFIHYHARGRNLEIAYDYVALMH